MNTPKLFLLRGLPGAGKTTLAKELVALGKAAYGEYAAFAVAADDYFDQFLDGKFDGTKLKDAHQWCIDRVAIGMEEDMTPMIVVHNTFTTDKEMAPYVELAQVHGYQLTSLVVENRHGGSSVHNVPEDTMERMEQRFGVKLR